MFDTVRDRGLRRALESDYRELQLALLNGLSKASLVLAGGIVEAVLVDFLLVVGYRSTRGTDPTDMQLAELIRAGTDEGALSQETASLCHVLKQYRNLIHPGRLAREGESVDLSQAEVAEKLVQRVVTDVGRRASARPEWAADHVLEAVTIACGDPAVIDRKLTALSASELERLLVAVIPDCFAERLPGADPEDEDYANFIAVCDMTYRAAAERASGSVRAEAARRLLRDLENDSEDAAADWLGVFFSAALLEDLDGEERAALLSYVLQVTGSPYADSPPVSLQGVGPYLAPTEAAALAHLLSYKAAGERGRRSEYAQLLMAEEFPALTEVAQASAREAMDAVIRDSRIASDKAVELSELRYRLWPLEDEEIPR